MIQLIQGDCLKAMSELAPQSIDLVLTDLPYGSTRCKWDSIIPLEPLWEQYRRIIKPGGALCFTATMPFAAALVSSNYDWFKWEHVWNKKKPSNFLLSKIMPLMSHETIQVFGNGKITYNPQMTKGKKRNKTGQNKEQFKEDGGWGKVKFVGRENVNDDYYPKSIIEISNAAQRGKIHRAQKPVELMSYFIKTYSNPGAVVLDNAMGSGSTGIACLETGRDFIGIEIDPEIFAKAKERIEAWEPAA